MIAWTKSEPRDAAEWFARLNSGALAQAEREQFEGWLVDDVDNALALAKLDALWRDTEALKIHPDILRMREQAVAGLRCRRTQRIALGAVAACLFAGLIIGALLLGRDWLSTTDQNQMFATRIGQRSSIVLADGSLAILDTNSLLRVQFDDDERHVELVRGRAFFKVAHRSKSSFVVKAGGHNVVALGTQFDVDLRDTELRVDLTEGHLRVRENAGVKRGAAEVDMYPGYRLVANARGVSVRKIDTLTATSWLRGRLYFDDATLGEIAAELTRYSKRPIIVDPAVASRRMSAVLSSDSPETFIASADALGLAHGEMGPDGYRLSAKK